MTLASAGAGIFVVAGIALTVKMFLDDPDVFRKNSPDWPDCLMRAIVPLDSLMMPAAIMLITASPVRRLLRLT